MRTVKIVVNSGTTYLDTKSKLSSRKVLLEIKEDVDTILVALAKNRNIRAIILSNLADKLNITATSLKSILDKESNVKTEPVRKTKVVEEQDQKPTKVKKKETSKFADLSKIKEFSSNEAKSLIKKVRVDKKKKDRLIPKFSSYCLSLLENIYAITPYLEALKNDVPSKKVTFGTPYMSIAQSKAVNYSKDFVAVVLPFKVEENNDIKYMSISGVCSTRNPEVLRSNYKESTYYHVEFNEQERIMKAGIENTMPLIIKDNYTTPIEAVMAVINKLRNN